MGIFTEYEVEAITDIFKKGNSIRRKSIHHFSKDGTKYKNEPSSKDAYKMWEVAKKSIDESMGIIKRLKKGRELSLTDYHIIQKTLIRTMKYQAKLLSDYNDDGTLYRSEPVTEGHIIHFKNILQYIKKIKDILVKLPITYTFEP